MSCRPLLIIILALSGFWTVLLSGPLAVKATAATVLIYHHFGDDRYPTTNVPLDNFRAQMDYLRAHDYQVITLARLVRILIDGQPLPEKAVVITIDDGYRSIYDRAWPILKEFAYPFTVFLYVEGLEKGYSNYLTWAQVKEMQAAGVDFQDHGYSHARMANPPPGLDDRAYRQWLKGDLVKSGRILQQRLGLRPDYLAVPYGEYSRELLDEAKKLGYEAILSQDPGAVGRETPPLMIPREPILGRDWATLKHFEEILEREDLPINDPAPPPGRLRDNPGFFSARVRHPERYRPDSFGIYVSQYGWLPARLEGDLIKVKNPGRLTRRLNRVILSAWDKVSGRTALRTWLLVLPVEVEPAD